MLILSLAVSATAQVLTCPCDQLSSCDLYCCCDGTCGDAAKTWSALKVCLSNYEGGLAIPVCGNSAISKLQLEGGLQLIYGFIKRLICISRVNAPASVMYSSSFQTPSSIPAFKISIPPTPKYKLLFGSDFTCGLKEVTALVNQESECLTYFTTLIDQLKPDYKLMAQGFNSFQQTYYNLVDGSNTKLATTLAGSNLNNFVREVYYTANVANNHLLIEYVIGSTTLGANPYSVRQKFKLRWVNGSQSGNAAGYGYVTGSKIGIITNSKYAQGELRFSFCDSSDLQTLVLQFGKDTSLFCWGSSPVNYQLILKDLAIGKHALSNTSRPADFIKVVSANYANWLGFELLVEYRRISTSEYMQYAITGVSLNGLTSTSVVGAKHAVFVRYLERAAVPQFYMASPPSIQTYLPDDVLYPFTS